MSVPANQPSRKEPGPVDVAGLTRALAAPFTAGEVHFKPAVVSGNRALALAYVDARAIQDRLDSVLGVDGWQDDYECLPDGSVVCRLRLRLGDTWVTKVDVGGPSEQPDGGDRLKAAFSDALKRAAVKFGIGRYLYRLPAQWADYDPQRRQFTRTPNLSPLAEAPREPAPKALPQEPPAPSKPAPRGPRNAPPINGAELLKRLQDYDARLAAQKICRQGDLVKHVIQAGVKAGHGPDLAAWTGPAMTLAAEETRVFEAQARKGQLPHKDVA